MFDDDLITGLDAHQRYWYPHDLRTIPLGDLITHEEPEVEPDLWEYRRRGMVRRRHKEQSMASIRELVTGKTDIPIPPAVDDRFPPSDGAEQPMSSMAASYLPGLREVARSLHQKVLIAGCLHGNVGPKWATHPKIELWTSQDESKWKRSPIPQDIGAVILLKWVSHGASQRLMREARERDILYTGIISTGDVRQLLDEAFKGWAAPRLVREPAMSAWERVKATTEPAIVAERAAAAAPSLPPTPPEPPSAPTEPTEPDPLPLPQDPPPTAPPQRASGRGPDKGKRATGIGHVILAVGGRTDTPAYATEAQRILPRVHEHFPTATVRQVAKLLQNMRSRGIRTVEDLRQQPPAEILVPAAVSSAPPAVPVQLPAPAPPSAPDADISIEEALEALAQSAAAIEAARGALLAAKRNMTETILKAVEDGVMDALANATARFRK